MRFSDDPVAHTLLYDKKQRVDITMAQGLLFDVDQYCRSLGITRSAFLSMAAERMLPYTYRTRDF